MAASHGILNLDERLRIVLIAAVTLVAAVMTLIFLANGITGVFPYFYFIPIVLAAYWYRIRGFAFTACLAAFYLLSVYLLLSPGVWQMVAAAVQATVFLAIAAVVASLSIIIVRDEQAFLHSEERFRSVWESIQAGIFIIDAKTHQIAAANPEAEKMTGYQEQEMIGHDCHQFICPSLGEECPANDPSKSVDRVEGILLTRDGKQLPVLKSIRQMTIAKQVYCVENVVDISGLKEAENALIAYIREAALRIKNPVTLVKDDLADIRTRFANGEMTAESLALELQVQEKHMEEIQKNLSELDAAIVEKRKEIPDALKEYLRR
jgi:PAS domain S-box-containing protein